MPTDKPRIQAYIEPELHQKLKEFQQERDLKESPALNQILREYFGVEDFSRTATQTIDAEKIRVLVAGECQIWANKLLATINSKLELFGIRLDTLESIVKPIEESLELEDNVQSELPSDSPETHSEPLPADIPESLNAADLAKRLSTAKSTISRRKGEADFEEWSQGKDPDDIGWLYDRSSQMFSPALASLINESQ